MHPPGAQRPGDRRERRKGNPADADDARTALHWVRRPGHRRERRKGNPADADDARGGSLNPSTHWVELLHPSGAQRPGDRRETRKGNPADADDARVAAH